MAFALRSGSGAPPCGVHAAVPFEARRHPCEADMVAEIEAVRRLGVIVVHTGVLEDDASLAGARILVCEADDVLVSAKTVAELRADSCCDTVDIGLAELVDEALPLALVDIDCERDTEPEQDGRGCSERD